MENTFSSAAASGSRDADHRKMFLFWACFFALVTTSFGFVIRVMLMDTWATEFGLSQTQKGEIFGVGLWPYALSIVLFSLIVDRIGYGRAIICGRLSRDLGHRHHLRKRLLGTLCGQPDRGAGQRDR